MKLPKQESGIDLGERIKRYLATIPSSVADHGGDLQLFCVACAVAHGFAQDREAAIGWMQHYNQRSDPPWSQHRLEYKVDEALRINTHEKPRGHLIDDDSTSWDFYQSKPSGNGADHRQQKEGKPDDATFIDGAQVLLDSMLSIENEESEIRFNCGDDLAGFELCPGKITIVGAPPGTGKTTLASQACFHAIANHPDVGLWIANAEMEPGVLTKRELARRSGVPYRKIRFATYSGAEKVKVQQAGVELTPLMARTSLMAPPYTMERLIEALPETPGIVVLDYLQKFRSSKHHETHEGIEAVMGLMRYIAMAGWAVLALSSTARQEGSGNKHDSKKLDMGSFRGSGEIEFQADFAYVLRDLSGDAQGDKSMQLDCVKNRHDSRESIELTFVGKTMRFEAAMPQRHAEFDGYEREF